MGLLYECDRCKALMKPSDKMVLVEFTPIDPDDKRVISGPKKSHYYLCPNCGNVMVRRIRDNS